jgi:PPOX class probable F420-dependent enzyme
MTSMASHVTAANTAPEPGGGPFDRFRTQSTILLTTYRRDGTAVGTPVHIAVVGPIAYVRTFEPSGKMKRMRRRADVEIAPCTIRGRVTGPAMTATARILDGAEAATAADALRRKYPFVHGRLIPWYHRRTHRTTMHVMLSPR